MDGGSRQDYTAAYSEMTGEHEANEEQDKCGDGLDELRRKGII